MLPPWDNVLEHDLSHYDAPTQEHIRHLLTRINPATSPEDKFTIEEVLIKFQDVFSRDGKVGTINCYTHIIHVSENVQPFQANPVPKPKDQLEFEQQAIQDLIALDKIEVSTAPFTSPILIVPKKGPKKYRMVINYKKANKFINDSSWPISTIASVFGFKAGRNTCRN